MQYNCIWLLIFLGVVNCDSTSSDPTLDCIFAEYNSTNLNIHCKTSDNNGKSCPFLEISSSQPNEHVPDLINSDQPCLIELECLYKDPLPQQCEEKINKLKNLSQLVITNTTISVPMSAVLSKFSQLTQLELSNDNIIQTFDKLPKLTNFTLSNSTIKYLSCQVFSSFSENSFKNVEPNSIGELNCRNVTDDILATIGKSELKQITTLKLIRSNITEIPSTYLESLNSTKIDVSNNNITQLDCSKVEYLFAAGNSFHSNNFKHIYCTDAVWNVTIAHEIISNSSSILEVLNLASNPNATQLIEGITKFNSLKELNVSNAQIKAFEFDLLNTGTIEHIDLSNNQLEDSCIESLKNFTDHFNTTVKKGTEDLKTDFITPSNFKNLIKLELSCDKEVEPNSKRACVVYIETKNENQNGSSSGWIITLLVIAIIAAILFVVWYFELIKKCRGYMSVAH